MKAVVISDTHGLHYDCKAVPDGDILIHCGDISNVGGMDDVHDFMSWFEAHPHPHKIFIAGNHDRSFDPKFNKKNDEVKPLWVTNALNSLKGTNVHYLENTSVTIEGIKFWGSPITPDFFPEQWAFNRPRGTAINKYWKTIPMDTDVVITHGPPEFKLDTVVEHNGYGHRFVGCADLRYAIEMIKPKYHLFGHIHEGYGMIESNGTCYVNASLLDRYYRPVNEPIVIEL